MVKEDFKVNFEFTIPMSDAFKNLFEGCGLGGRGNRFYCVYNLEKNVLVGSIGCTVYEECQEDKNSDDYDDLPF